MKNLNENEICLNYGYLSDCKDCNCSLNLQCNSYESKDTRLKELELIKVKFEN